MRGLAVLIIAVFFVAIAPAQELNCVVTINAKKIGGTETRIYETLEKAIFNFMNNTKWTSDIYSVDERIECSIFITLNERSGTGFNATIQISSRRTAYNSSYYSPMFNHLDEDFDFTYLEYSPLEFTINSYLNNLTSVLAFYAYFIIGIDYDSYSLKGGSVYFDKALKIVNNAQSVEVDGWKAFESDRNRYWLAENMNNDFYSPLRDCMYKYHLKGLDIMWNNTDAGRKVISDALNGLDKIHQARPSSFIMKVFFNAKSDEVVHIFQDGLPAEKNQISRLLTSIDPGNAQKYDKITGQ